MQELNKQDRTAGIAMLAPAVMFLIMMTAIPLTYVLYASLSDWNLTRSAVPHLSGFGNYAKMFADSYFYNAIRVTAYFSVSSLILEIVLGTMIALLLFRNFSGRGIVRSFMLIPMMITPAVIGLIWRIMLNSDFGVISFILTSFNIDAPSFLSDPRTALPSLIAVDVWEWTPFISLSVLAALQSRSHDQVESALIDGASSVKIFRYITFPHIQPVLFIAASFRMGALLRWFDTIYVMTAGGPGRATQNLPMYIYQTGFYYLNMGYSAALAVFLLVLTIGITYFFVHRSKISDI